MAGSAPEFAADGKGFTLEWVRSVLGEDVTSVEVQVLTDVGGFMGEVNRVRVERDGQPAASYIFKQIVGEGKMVTSKAIGCAREAFFYNSALAKEVASELPATAYAYGDMETGEKYLMMEDLSAGVQAGLLFGPTNPNNWAKQQAGELDAIAARHLKDGVTVETVCTEVCRAMGRIHARFWKDRTLLEGKQWLRGTDWWQREGKEAWSGAMRGAQDAWAKSAERRAAAPDVWDAELTAVVEASLAKVCFEDYLAWTHESAWTLVHGDFHPGNVMWMGGDAPVKLVDWEMVGVGNPTQEVGQFMVSHTVPAVRRECEERVVRAYHKELEKGGVTSYSWEQCWSDYVDGAVGRWAWFMAWMALNMPPPLAKFFNGQFMAFVRDHGITPENVVQPRV